MNSENQAYMAGVGEEGLSTFFGILPGKSSKTDPLFLSKSGMLLISDFRWKRQQSGGEEK
jgi:hypothetical protein